MQRWTAEAVRVRLATIAEFRLVSLLPKAHRNPSATLEHMQIPGLAPVAHSTAARTCVVVITYAQRSLHVVPARGSQ